MSSQSHAISILEDWYQSLRTFHGALPARGSIGAALFVLGRLRSSYDLDIKSQVAIKKTQIAGLSADSLRAVLSEFGEARELSSIGGRTNRGSVDDVELLLNRMRELNLERASDEKRRLILNAMMRHIVSDYVRRYHELKRVKAMFDPTGATRSAIARILQDARRNGKVGAVAQHIVGAKLALRFPDDQIANEQSNAADMQTNRVADFQIGDTAFHVTVSPMPGLFDKCKGNLESGVRVYLLVPDDQLAGARQNAELQLAGRVAVESIESFVATNIDELSHFDGERLKSGFRCLLEKYNERVDASELDKSLLIEIPPNVQ